MELVNPNVVIMNVFASKILQIMSDNDISFTDALQIGLNSSVSLSNYNFNKKNTKDNLQKLVENKKIRADLLENTITTHAFPSHLPKELQEINLLKPDKIEIDGEFNIFEDGKLFEKTDLSRAIKITCPKGSKRLDFQDRIFACQE